MYSGEVPYESAAPAADEPAPAAEPAPAPAEPQAAEPAPAEPPAAKPPAEKKPADDDSAATESGSALLTVSVPEDASVVVNGFQTKAVGSVREFKSSGLMPGFVYTYDIEVTYTVDGEERTENKSVKLRSGMRQSVAFANDSAPTEEEGCDRGQVECSCRCHCDIGWQQDTRERNRKNVPDIANENR